MGEYAHSQLKKRKKRKKGNVIKIHAKRLK